jgi:tryptophanyl-tRNA synthetase
MAADILLYKATLVPVGEDQRQHLELTRDIAGRFNGLYGPIFPLPEAYIPDAGARIMSLQDPGKKMSKSDDVDANVVTLLDPPDAIARKIKRCVTDPGRDIVADPDKPGVSNLLNILSATTDVSIAALENRYRGQGYGQLKADVADAVIALIEPIQARFGEIRSNAGELDAVLASGADKAREAARTTLADVSDALGLIPR